MSLVVEELAEKYGFTNQGYERSDFVAALKELKERCAKEADHYAADASEAMNDEVQAVCERIAARIRSL